MGKKLLNKLEVAGPNRERERGRIMQIAGEFIRGDVAIAVGVLGIGGLRDGDAIEDRGRYDREVTVGEAESDEAPERGEFGVLAASVGFAGRVGRDMRGEIGDDLEKQLEGEIAQRHGGFGEWKNMSGVGVAVLDQ